MATLYYSFAIFQQSVKDEEKSIWDVTAVFLALKWVWKLPFPLSCRLISHTWSLEFNKESATSGPKSLHVHVNKHLSQNLPECVASALAHDVGKICKLRRNSVKSAPIVACMNSEKKWVVVTSLLLSVCVALRLLKPVTDLIKWTFVPDPESGAGGQNRLGMFMWTPYPQGGTKCRRKEATIKGTANFPSPENLFVRSFISATPPPPPKANKSVPKEAHLFNFPMSLT